MKKWMYGMIISFILGIAGIAYALSIEADLTDNLVRLHIIANSNSEFDQTVKLLVRDEILSACKAYIKNGQTRCSIVNGSQYFADIATQKLHTLNAGYDADVRIEKFYFPRKSYDGITLPAGRYESIRVILGDGAGENWWCVAYPPLCFTQSTCGALNEDGEKLLEEQLSPESYALIHNPDGITYKFKIVEWFAKIKETL